MFVIKRLFLFVDLTSKTRKTQNSINTIIFFIQYLVLFNKHHAQEVGFFIFKIQDYTLKQTDTCLHLQ